MNNQTNNMNYTEVYKSYKPVKVKYKKTLDIVSLGEEIDKLEKIGLKGEIKFNDMTKKIELIGFPLLESSTSKIEELSSYLYAVLRGKYSIKGKHEIQDLIVLISDKNTNHYHPIKEHLETHKWSGVDRIQYIYDYLQVKTDLEKMMVRKWFLQCIGMLYNEGEYGAAGVLTLVGGQGVGKTTFFQSLVPMLDAFADGLKINTENKDNKIEAVKHWITELGEVDATTKKSQTDLKSFITSPKDLYRVPYGKESSSYPRTTSFCATTNEKTFLMESENRRFWVIEVGKIINQSKLQYIRDNVWDLWLQVYHMYFNENQGDFLCFHMDLSEMELIKEKSKNNVEQTPEIDMFLTYFTLEDSDKGEWYTATEIKKLIGLEPTSRKLGKYLKTLKDQGVLTKSLDGLIHYKLKSK